MVVPLFLHDNHAENIPNFHPISEDEFTQLVKLISQYYPVSIKKTATAKAIGGANLNSKNFVIDKFYIKIIALHDDVESLDTLPIIAEKLLNKGIPVGQFIKNYHGKNVTHHINSEEKKFCIYLQEFVTGEYYSGVSVQLKSCINLIQQLPTALDDIKPSYKQLSYYANWHPHEVVQMVKPLLYATKSNPTLFDEIANHYFEAASDIAQGNILSGVTSDRLNHVDLHPHNILMSNDQIACLLDLESFWAVPENVSVGFGLYKLARKSIANGLMTIKQVHELLNESFDTQKLIPFAHLEVARRFLTILKLHYVDRDYRWDADIGKQGVGFLEIDKIFKIN